MTTFAANPQLIRFKKLYELSMTLSGDPMDVVFKLVQMIAEIMDVKVVCVSEIRGRDLYFLSAYFRGKVYNNAGSCPLEITPCATVEESKDVRVYENVQELFPKAIFLKEHNAYSYCGLPSLGHNGDVVAVTCLLDDHPHEFSCEDKELLQIFGRRIGLEVERKNAQDSQRAMLAELEYSEQRFRDIARATGELMWEVDDNGRISYLSDLSLDILGHPAKYLIGRNLFDVLRTENPKRDIIQFRKSMRNGCSSCDTEYLLRLKGGKSVWLLVSSVAIHDRKGRTKGYRGTARDITESKCREENVLLERNLLRQILDSLSHIFIALLDRNGKVIEANRTPWAAAGIRREDYLGIQFGDSRAWSYDPAVQAQVRLAVLQARNGETIRYEAQILEANGIVDIDFCLVPLLNEEGQVEQIVACGVDISIRKKALEALRRTEEKLELAIEGAELGLWDWDVSSGVVECDERWAGMFGYTLEEIQRRNKRWERLVHPEDLPRVRDSMKSCLIGNTPFFEVEYRIQTKNDGWEWTLGRGKVVKRDADGKPLRVAGIDMNISQRKKLEEELRQRQDELYYAQRLTAAGELTAIVAHELNQPLGAIKNYLGGALLRFSDIFSANPDLSDVVEKTLELSQRATAVIQGIRALIRKQEGKRECVSLASVVDEVLMPLRTEISTKQITTSFDFPSTLPPLWCEKIHLQQLLLNLILNAIQSMDTPECSARKLKLSAKVNASHKLEFTISDSGPGIAPAIAERLFQPFVSTKAGGIGLGLSICRTIVEAYDGRISVRSIPRQGTAFDVVLPFRTEEIKHG